jgi:phosphoenolpyruvate-protein kinase (PTS system EI component)
MLGDVALQIANAVQAVTSTSDREAIAAALHVVRPIDLARFFHSSLAPGVSADALCRGLPASPGVAAGRIVLSADEALAASTRGERVILVRRETSPDDVLGMQSSVGLLTLRGGLVSHAAVVARGWGIPAVVGAADIELSDRTITIGDRVLHAGDVVTIDGSSGDVFAGRVGMITEEPPAELETLLRWADAVAAGHVEVRANADTSGDAAVGRRRGARGIGLCRTEHMFLSSDRLEIMRNFILSDDPATEADALAALEEAQTIDFESVLVEMDGLPVTVRLLDPPLHEFLPDLLGLVARVGAGDLDEAGREELKAVRRLHEVNPMLGTRGVRLGVMRPGLYEMQVRALCRAAVNLFDRGLTPRVELMIPLVVDAEELRIARSWVTGVLDELGHPELASDVVTVGAMIETPRAALTAGALAEHADFFSFGTNDLTQLTYAFSRDDVESRLLPAYQALDILPANPFAVLDQDGVGRLLRVACDEAREQRPGIKLGACGEHAGDPDSADFLVRLGVDSVSCSPFRIPLARLGVAQALLNCGRVDIDHVQFDDVAPADLDPGTTAPPAIEIGAGAPADLDAPLDVDDLLVLHVLRLRGFVTADGVTESLGTFPDELVERLVQDGLVRFVEARGIYALLAAGRERHQSSLDALGEIDRQRLADRYASFLELNSVFKELCTRWQLQGSEPNDHSDAAHDAQCIHDLVQLHRSVEPVIKQLAVVIPRMDRYRRRLRRAVDLVAAGDSTRFSGVNCGSYHDVWMELHEDLIVLQGIDRDVEGSF